MKDHRSVYRIALVSLFFILLTVVQTKAADRKNTEQPSRTRPSGGELIWPLPPDAPRVRWVAEYTDMTRVKKPGTKKRSGGFLDVITGIKTPEERTLELRKPYGITTDSKGRVYVADTELMVVFVLDTVAKTVVRLEGNSRAPMALPVGVATDSEDRLFVSDAQLHTITCFNPALKLIARFGTSSLGRPGGIAIDRQRSRLYVTDAKENRIAIFDTQKFSLIGYLGKAGEGKAKEAGTFAGPTNVAVDRNGNIYVADTLNCRIQIFDPAGKFIRILGTQGARPGEFIRPKGIALDSEGHVYVADAEFNNFQILSPEGQPLLAVGTLGTAPGEFGLIAGLHIDSADRIYTTEMYIGRVQVFQYIAQPISAEKKGGVSYK